MNAPWFSHLAAKTSKQNSVNISKENSLKIDRETIYQHTFSYNNPSGLNFERYTQSWAISRRSRPKTAEKYI